MEKWIIKTVYVIQGDTLWTIAKREQICNPYYEDKDIRDIVYELKKLIIYKRVIFM